MNTNKWSALVSSTLISHALSRSLCKASPRTAFTGMLKLGAKKLDIPQELSMPTTAA